MHDNTRATCCVSGPFRLSQDLLNIAPKRANWDLKRDMDKRMKKLERRTVECYAVLFRESPELCRGVGCMEAPGRCWAMAPRSAKRRQTDTAASRYIDSKKRHIVSRRGIEG